MRSKLLPFLLVFLVVVVGYYFVSNKTDIKVLETKERPDKSAESASSSESRQDNYDTTVAPYDGVTIICTMDAKICPDGSSVGRVGPKCEFAPCSGN